MKVPALLLLAVLAAAAPAQGSRRVSGYRTKSGTYVSPYRRTAANGTRRDNWSTKGNVNPYTGKRGSKSPYAPRRSRRG